MKAIDKLINKISVTETISQVDRLLIVQDLQQLKTKLKEQHKKDVIDAYNDCHSNMKAEQYYNNKNKTI